MPQSRPMPTVGRRVHELRVTDGGGEWRILYRTDADAVLVLEVFHKTTRTTPAQVLENCRRRLRAYDEG